MSEETQEQNQLEFQDILGIGMTLVVTVIGLSMGADVTGETRDSIGTDACAGRSDGFTSYNTTAEQCYNSTGSHVNVGTTDFNITGEGLTGLTRLSVKLPTIVTVMTIAIIIGVLVRHLYVRYQ